MSDTTFSDRPLPARSLSSSDSALPAKMQAWLTRAVELGASDLHLIIGYPPTLRLHGDLVDLPDPALDAEEGQALIQGTVFQGCPGAAGDAQERGLLVRAAGQRPG